MSKQNDQQRTTNESTGTSPLPQPRPGENDPNRVPDLDGSIRQDSPVGNPAIDGQPANNLSNRK